MNGRRTPSNDKRAYTRKTIKPLRLFIIMIIIYDYYLLEIFSLNKK